MTTIGGATSLATTRPGTDMTSRFDARMAQLSAGQPAQQEPSAPRGGEDSTGRKQDDARTDRRGKQPIAKDRTGNRQKHDA